MVEYRPIPDERALFHEYWSYAFTPENGPSPYDPDEHDTPRARLGSPRGVFVADADESGVGDTAAAGENNVRDAAGGDDADTASRPRCLCRHYWLDARVRGDHHPTAGIAGVATPPEYRRGGYVGELLEHSLAEFRDRGTRFAVLWPFKYRFYRQYGWDTCNRVATHECEPAHLSFARTAREEPGQGSFRRIDTESDSDAADILEPAYEAYAERYALTLERDREWWQCRLFENHGTDPFVYAYERDGRVRGYLIYTIEDEPARERTMDVFELAFDEYDDLLALLSFCRNHDSQVEQVRLRLPEDVPLLEIARDPDAFETSLETGPMVRIVDVAETLSALSYPDVTGTMTLDVSDSAADWNDGTFTLTAADGRGDCDRLASGADADVTGDDVDIDVRLDIGALSQLVVGYRSATALERTGRLEATDSSTVETLDSLFPETDVFLGDRF